MSYMYCRFSVSIDCFGIIQEHPSEIVSLQELYSTYIRGQSLYNQRKPVLSYSFYNCINADKKLLQSYIINRAIL